LPIIGARKPDDNHPALDPRRSIDEAWAYFEALDSGPQQQSAGERLDLKRWITRFSSPTAPGESLTPTFTRSMNDSLCSSKTASQSWRRLSRTTLFFEPVAPEPEKSSHDDAHYGLLMGHWISGQRTKSTTPLQLRQRDHWNGVEESCFGYRLSIAKILTSNQTNSSGPIQLLPARRHPCLR
jgi:hypothetical protein